MSIDMYNFRARQNPVTFALAPAIFAALAVVPELQSAWGFIGGVVAALGLPYCFAQAAGTAGKKLELGLYEAWGGMPSTAMLRHRDSRINEITKRSYFDLLRQVGIPMPTPEEEARDPVGADKAYEAAGDWLRRETRDPKTYPRVKTELTNYGLARNLLGLKWIGLFIAVISTLLQAALVARAAMTGAAVPHLLGLSLIFSATMIAFWLWRVGPAWARRTADAYAHALLEACERRRAPAAQIKATTAKKPRKTKLASPPPEVGTLVSGVNSTPLPVATEAPAQGSAVP